MIDDKPSLSQRTAAIIYVGWRVGQAVKLQENGSLRTGERPDPQAPPILRSPSHFITPPKTPRLVLTYAACLPRCRRNTSISANPSNPKLSVESVPGSGTPEDPGL